MYQFGQIMLTAVANKPPNLSDLFISLRYLAGAFHLGNRGLCLIPSTGSTIP